MSKFQFLRKVAKFKAQVPVMMDKMANNAVNHFKVTNFDAAGFVDSTIKKWAPIKKSDGRQPLVKTGRLRGSIRVLGSSFYARKIGSDVPYAGYHNEGTGRLPQRQFIGSSRILEIKNGRVIISSIKGIL